VRFLSDVDNALYRIVASQGDALDTLRLPASLTARLTSYRTFRAP
jgi:hypothetical protein